DIPFVKIEIDVLQLNLHTTILTLGDDFLRIIITFHEQLDGVSKFSFVIRNKLFRMWNVKIADSLNPILLIWLGYKSVLRRLPYHYLRNQNIVLVVKRNRRSRKWLFRVFILHVSFHEVAVFILNPNETIKVIAAFPIRRQISGVFLIPNDEREIIHSTIQRFAEIHRFCENAVVHLRRENVQSAHSLMSI